jgi:signal transduction histidine kinase
VIGFTDLLLKGIDGPLNDRQQKAIASIAQESEKLVVIIGDILDTSKLNAGRLELDSRWVPSVEILTECEAAARRLIGNRNVKLVSEFQPGLPPVFIDKDRIRQALVSLLARVIDSVEQGTIRLRASRFLAEEENKYWLKVDIIDDYRVIGNDERARIEQAFRLKEGADLELGSNSLSLGIALARDIIQLHNGQLYAVNEEGFGAIFAMILPLDEP